MVHARQQIRERVATIVGSLTTTGSRVHQSRVYNVQESELPCLLIYTVSEEVEGPQTIGQARRIVRVLELMIEGKAQATSTLDDTLDNIAAEVEAAIGADQSLGINVLDTLLASVEIDYTAEGDKPIGSISMRYAVTYITTESDPTTLI